MADASLPITRLLPADLQEAINKWGDISMADVITNLQTDSRGLDHDCPKCANGEEGASTGFLVIPIDEASNAKAICDLCGGYMKTAGEYVAVDKVAGYALVE